jgi:hypothetical protein
MSMRSLLAPILDDEHVTRGLGDAEARMLVDWLVERAERLHGLDPDERRVQVEVKGLCGRARAVARFVALWCHERVRGAALQLAATERFAWPLPVSEVDPCDLLSDILAWEDQRPELEA